MFLLFALPLVFVFGFMFMRACFPKISVSQQVWLAFPMGIGLKTLMMFVGSLTIFPFAAWSSMLTLILAIGLLGYIQFKQKNLPRMSEFKEQFDQMLISMDSYKWYEWILLLLIVLLAALILMNSFYWPIYLWDSLYTYDFDARAYAVHGSIVEAILNQPHAGVGGYPPFMQLTNTFAYVFDFQYPKVSYGLIFVSMIGIFYHALKQYTSRIVSLIFTFLLILSPMIVTYAPTSYTNFPFTFYYAFGAIYLYHWVKNKRTEDLFISILLLGLSYWVRPHAIHFFIPLYFIFLLPNIAKKHWWHFVPAFFALVGLYRAMPEYFTYAGLAYLVVLFFILNTRKVFYYFLIFFFAIQITGYGWNQYYSKVIVPIPKSTHFMYVGLARYGQSFKEDVALEQEEIEGKLTDPEHLQSVALYVWEALRGGLGYTLYLFLIIAALNIRYTFRENTYIFLVVAINMAIFSGGTLIYSIAIHNWASIIGSAKRLMMLLLPIVVFYMATSVIVKKAFNVPLEGEEVGEEEEGDGEVEEMEEEREEREEY